MKIHIGEIYGKQNSGKFAMYCVVNIGKHGVTLQNLDNPLSIFETTVEKLTHAGYARISETPFVDMSTRNRKRVTMHRPKRCPYTLDIFEGRADCERPHIIPLPDEKPYTKAA